MYSKAAIDINTYIDTRRNFEMKTAKVYTSRVFDQTIALEIRSCKS